MMLTKLCAACDGGWVQRCALPLPKRAPPSPPAGPSPAADKLWDERSALVLPAATDAAQTRLPAWMGAVRTITALRPLSTPC